jgi:hypothetical protein
VCPSLVVVSLVRIEQMAEMSFAEHNNMVKTIRRIEPMSLSAFPFCHDGRRRPAVGARRLGGRSR